MIKLRITLESKENVIRELIIDENLNLEDLHKSIIQNFQLNEFEMASFYQTDSNLNLGKEISLFDTSEKAGDTLVMNQVSITSLLHSSETQLIYVYDFLKMWRFHIQFIENKKAGEGEDLISVGSMPNEAPEISFDEQKQKKGFDPYEDVFDDFDEFNNYEY